MVWTALMKMGLLSSPQQYTVGSTVRVTAAGHAESLSGIREGIELTVIGCNYYPTLGYWEYLCGRQSPTGYSYTVYLEEHWIEQGGNGG